MKGKEELRNERFIRSKNELTNRSKEAFNESTDRPRQWARKKATESIEQSIREKLRSILDPEVGINILDLGLVRRVSANDEDIEIEMTLTSPGCPVGPLILQEVENAIKASWPEHDVLLSLTFDPPWSPERISPAGREALQI
ncbi:MAG TPA: hypothetical protein DEA96_08115 [Leptospiraceae bacterium]|nr:hypothetical protein [Spirochaetaceae bacterium]HBS04913.1 hypothetical protein [Leptospiraceae bacterium]|tara:strand:- start:209 stop:634 length:426 start_codon:yes stop_codon:yes gene_type:complete